MKVINLKKSFLKYYISLIFIFTICLCTGLACVIYGIFKIDVGIEKLKDYFLIPFGLIFMILGFFSIRSYILNSTSLKIYNNQLYHKNEIITNEIIENISFRNPFVLWGGYNTLATIIHLKDGNTIRLVELFYANADIFHKFIFQNLMRNEYFDIPKRNSNIENNFEVDIILKGNLLFSYRSLFIIWLPLGVTLFFLFNPIKIIPPIEIQIFLSIFIVLYFLLQFYFIFTIKLTNCSIIVKHYLLSYNKSFEANNIYEIHFIYRPKLPNQIKITTNDFKTYTYFMGTLRVNDEWIVLKNHLERKGIKVTNWGVI